MSVGPPTPWNWEVQATVVCGHPSPLSPMWSQNYSTYKTDSILVEFCRRGKWCGWKHGLHSSHGRIDVRYTVYRHCIDGWWNWICCLAYLCCCISQSYDNLLIFRSMLLSSSLFDYWVRKGYAILMRKRSFRIFRSSNYSELRKCKTQKWEWVLGER